MLEILNGLKKNEVTLCSSLSRDKLFSSFGLSTRLSPHFLLWTSRLTDAQEHFVLVKLQQES